jgi:hypothetical protein
MIAFTPGPRKTLRDAQNHLGDRVSLAGPSQVSRTNSVTASRNSAPALKNSRWQSSWPRILGAELFRCGSIEEALGWLKTVALLRKTWHRGVARVGRMFTSQRPRPTRCAYAIVACPMFSLVGRLPCPPPVLASPLFGHVAGTIRPSDSPATYMDLRLKAFSNQPAASSPNGRR